MDTYKSLIYVKEYYQMNIYVKQKGCLSDR